MKLIDPKIINGVICLSCFIIGDYIGYYNGLNKSDLDWKEKLVQKDFAEYNRRTGVWEFRKMEDIVTAEFILNSGKSTSELLYEDRPAVKVQRVSPGSLESRSLTSHAHK